ncbi:MAG: DUF4328 domain-containing protein [Dehalococcoidia bacterium]
MATNGAGTRGERRDDDSRSRRGTRPARRVSRPAPTGARGMMHRFGGRDLADAAREKRYQPYSFETNGGTLRWLLIALVIWVAVSLFLAWNDRATANMLADWRDQGVQAIPPTEPHPQALLDFAAAEGIDCHTEAEILAGTPGCERVLDFYSDFADAQNRSNLILALLVVVFIGVIFPFGTFAHRANRNLLTLKSAGQRFKPEWAVIWFFVPVMNFYKPWQVFRELFKGSDPAVSTEDPEAWKKKGRTPPILHVWWLLLILALIFNPILLARFSVRENVADVAAVAQRLMWSDVLLAVVGVAAMLMAIELHRRQEIRHARVGPVTVTPELPRDPIEEALEEGARKQQQRMSKAKSKKSKGR